MPVDRSLAVDLADNMVTLYARMESRMLTELAALLKRNPNPTERAKLDALRTIRERTEKALRVLKTETGDEALAAITQAYVRGGRAALAEIAATRSKADRKWWERRGFILGAFARLMGIAGPASRQRKQRLTEELNRLRDALPGIDAIQVLAGELTQRLSSTHHRVLRWDQDAYRRVVAESSAPVLAGTATRLRAGQVTWERLIADGVTGFTDKSGRKWRLRSYVEMATRTTVAQAALEAQLEYLTDGGYDLGIVSNAPQECKLCRPFEGRVVAISGGTGPREVPHELTGETITINVVATVASAITAGLFHPACRHSLSLYLPGVTKAPTHTADPEGDAARQRLRALEREVRKWKEIEALSLTPEGKRRARSKVRDYQGRIRDHVADTGLLRQRNREQISDLDLIDSPNTGADPPPPILPVEVKAQPPPDGPDLDEDDFDEESGMDIPWNADVGELIPELGHHLTGDDKERVRDVVTEKFEEWEHGDFRVNIDGVDVQSGRVSIGGSIRADGVPAGSFQRVLHRDDDTLWVYHAYLSLEPDFQGQGFANAFNDWLYGWYARSGVSHVKVHANIDVGGYTWARQGFDFEDGYAAEHILDRLRDAMSGYDAGDGEYSATQIVAAQGILDRAETFEFGDDEYPTAYEVSQAGRIDGDDSWIGKEAMLGSNWHGVRWM